MKKLILPVLCIFFTACTSTFYQIYKATPEGGKLSESNIVFEDDKCRVTYNLWSEGGDAGFNVYNKTDDDLSILTNKSFFVLNGVTHDYFKNRVFTKTSNVASGLSGNSKKPKIVTTTSVSNSTSFSESDNVIIPSKASRNISEYTVNNVLYRNCELFKYPSRKKIKTLKFEKNNSPFVFYNLITYVSKFDTIRMENRFFVSEITNLPEKEAVNSEYEKNCGVQTTRQIKIIKDIAPDKFFIIYSNYKDTEDN